MPATGENMTKELTHILHARDDPLSSEEQQRVRALLQSLLDLELDPEVLAKAQLSSVLYNLLPAFINRCDGVTFGYELEAALSKFEKAEQEAEDVLLARTILESSSGGEGDDVNDQVQGHSLAEPSGIRSPSARPPPVGTLSAKGDAGNSASQAETTELPIRQKTTKSPSGRDLGAQLRSSIQAQGVPPAAPTEDKVELQSEQQDIEQRITTTKSHIAKADRISARIARPIRQKCEAKRELESTRNARREADPHDPELQALSAQLKALKKEIADEVASVNSEQIKQARCRERWQDELNELCARKGELEKALKGSRGGEGSSGVRKDVYDLDTDSESESENGDDAEDSDGGISEQETTPTPQSSGSDSEDANVGDEDGDDEALSSGEESYTEEDDVHESDTEGPVHSSELGITNVQSLHETDEQRSVNDHNGDSDDESSINLNDEDINEELQRLERYRSRLLELKHRGKARDSPPDNIVATRPTWSNVLPVTPSPKRKRALDSIGTDPFVSSSKGRDLQYIDSDSESEQPIRKKLDGHKEGFTTEPAATPSKRYTGAASNDPARNDSAYRRRSYGKSSPTPLSKYPAKHSSVMNIDSDSEIETESEPGKTSSPSELFTLDDIENFADRCRVQQMLDIVYDVDIESCYEVLIQSGRDTDSAIERLLGIKEQFDQQPAHKSGPWKKAKENFRKFFVLMYGGLEVPQSDGSGEFENGGSDTREMMSKFEELPDAGNAGGDDLSASPSSVRRCGLKAAKLRDLQQKKYFCSESSFLDGPQPTRVLRGGDSGGADGFAGLCEDASVSSGRQSRLAKHNVCKIVMLILERRMIPLFLDCLAKPVDELFLPHIYHTARMYLRV